VRWPAFKNWSRLSENNIAFLLFKRSQWCPKVFD
jgi:hypothetical protein